MNPYGYQVPRTLGWGALGDDAPAGTAYVPPSGWTLLDAPQIVTSVNQGSLTAMGTAPCSVFDLAVEGDPIGGEKTYMPPLGWYVATIANAQGDHEIIWIDPNSRVTYNLQDCSTGSMSLGPTGPVTGWGGVLVVALLLGGLLYVANRADKKERRSLAVARKRPKRKSRKLRAARRKQSARRFASGGSRRSRRRARGSGF